MLCATAVHIITSHSATNYREFLSSEGIHMDFPDHLSYVNSAVSADTPCLGVQTGHGRQGAHFTV